MTYNVYKYLKNRERTGRGRYQPKNLFLGRSAWKRKIARSKSKKFDTSRTAKEGRYYYSKKKLYRNLRSITAQAKRKRPRGRRSRYQNYS